MAIANPILPFARRSSPPGVLRAGWWGYRRETPLKRVGLTVVAVLLFGTCCGQALADAPPDSPVTKKQLEAAATEAKQNGDIAWMLMSTGLVLLMVPGLAL